jgi:hypothetical protein
VLDGEKFMVAIDMPECAPSQNSRASGGPYYQSTSNLEDEGIINTGITSVKAGEISVYPNPFDSYFTISSETPIFSIRLYNVLGELVFEENNILKRTYIVNRQNLVSGAYMLELNGNKGINIIKD